MSQDRHPNQNGLPHQPSDERRATVRALAAYGCPQEQICAVLDLDPKTLRKHYRHELDIAMTEANAKVAEALFKKATGEGPAAVTAAIFWLKTRAGWKETQKHEHSGPEGGPVELRDATARDILADRIARLAAAEEEGGGSDEPPAGAG